MGNASDQSSQHKLDTLKNTMINEGIVIIEISEVNSNWSKIPIREKLYNRTDIWFKTRRISTRYKKSPSTVDHFKAEAQLSWG